MRFTIVVDGFVIAGNKINMHVGGNRVSTVSDDSPNGRGRGKRERESNICFAYLAAFLRLLWGNCSAHDVPHVNRMCYFLLQDIV